MDEQLVLCRFRSGHLDDIELFVFREHESFHQFSFSRAYNRAADLISIDLSVYNDISVEMLQQWRNLNLRKMHEAKKLGEGCYRGESRAICIWRWQEARKCQITIELGM
jgi:hypothetical protein